MPAQSRAQSDMSNNPNGPVLSRSGRLPYFPDPPGAFRLSGTRP